LRGASAGPQPQPHRLRARTAAVMETLRISPSSTLAAVTIAFDFAARQS
jgi:hypothetical protein